VLGAADGKSRECGTMRGNKPGGKGGTRNAVWCLHAQVQDIEGVQSSKWGGGRKKDQLGSKEGGKLPVKN